LKRGREVRMLGRIVCGFMVLCALSAPVMAAETADRETSPYNFGSKSSPSILKKPLPDILEQGGRAVRVTYFDFDNNRYAYIIESHEDGRPMKFRFEKFGPAQGFGGIWYDKKSKGSRELTAAEARAFRTTFENVKICSTPKYGLDLIDGDVVFVEFANDTRHCFATRQEPGYKGVGLEFREIYHLVEGFSER
jgi:hypothetical protein